MFNKYFSTIVPFVI